jgi:tripartite ATP-independent transporter DctP family solute receptor
MLKLPVLCDRFFSNPSSRVATDQHWEEKTMKSITRRMLLACAVSIGAAGFAPAAFAEDKITLRMSTPASETDQRSVALAEVFAPAVADFATYQPHYNASLIAQGSELESIASGDLEMSIASAQELATFFPEFSIFATGYVHQDAAHQVAVFNDPLMDPFKQKVEDELGVKLLAVMYLGRRHVNLRQSKDELTVMTPADLAGVNLRMPGSDAWQFLGKALGANPTPMAFTEVYTALSTGSVDGQDNPLPTVVDAKFYEVTKQIALTSHLVDLNYVAFSKAVWDQLTPEQQATVQKAAEDAAESGRQAQLKKEEDLVAFLRENGLEIYEPDLAAFRTHVQAQYVGSEFAASWPEGVLDKINALGN